MSHSRNLKQDIYKIKKQRIIFIFRNFFKFNLDQLILNLFFIFSAQIWTESVLADNAPFVPPFLSGNFSSEQNEFVLAQEFSEFSVQLKDLAQDKQKQGFACYEGLEKYYCQKSLKDTEVAEFYKSAVEEFFLNTYFKFYQPFDVLKRTWLSEAYEQWMVPQKVVVYKDNLDLDRNILDVFYLSQLNRNFLTWSTSIGDDSQNENPLDPKYKFVILDDKNIVLHKIFRFKLSNVADENHWLTLQYNSKYSNIDQ